MIHDEDRLRFIRIKGKQLFLNKKAEGGEIHIPPPPFTTTSNSKTYREI
jgi:hypothetical protein